MLKPSKIFVPKSVSPAHLKIWAGICWSIRPKMVKYWRLSGGWESWFGKVLNTGNDKIVMAALLITVAGAKETISCAYCAYVPIHWLVGTKDCFRGASKTDMGKFGSFSKCDPTPLTGPSVADKCLKYLEGEGIPSNSESCQFSIFLPLLGSWSPRSQDRRVTNQAATYEVVASKQEKMQNICSKMTEPQI